MKLNEPSSLLPSLPRGAEILILRLRSLGDIILETPAIAALHAWRPDLRICVLVERRFAAALEGNPAIAEVLFSRGLCETARALRRRKFPVVFNQHGGPRSALLTAASGSPVRVCWEGFQFSFLYNAHAPDAAEFYGTSIVHAVEHRISQFYWLGLPREPIPVARIFPRPGMRAFVARTLASSGVPPDMPYAVLQPGARSHTMRWPVGKYAQIARWLREARGIACVVNLGSQDEMIAGEVRREMRDCAVIPQAFELPEMIALIAGACLFVGNDSGPAHVAAAAGRPSVVIYGPTNPVQWRPWGTEHRVVETGARFRAVRGDKSVAVGGPSSIQSIEVDEVRDACEGLLAAGCNDSGAGDIRTDTAGSPAA